MTSTLLALDQCQYVDVAGGYIFLFNDAHRDDVLRTLGRFAASPELSMTWREAAELSSRMRKANGG